MDQLLLDEQHLHETADTLLSDICLMEQLSLYGSVTIGGAYKYGVLVNRDIDLHLTVVQLDETNRVQLRKQIAAHILQSPLVNMLKVVDFVGVPPSPGKLRGFWFGVTLLFHDKEWSIDLWVTTAEELDQPQIVQLSQLTQEKLKNLSDDDRLTILQLKQYLQNQHPKTYRSAALYEGVLEHDISTADELEAYLSQRPGAKRKA